MHICRFQILHLTATEATRAAVRDFVNPKQALCVYASQVYSPRCASKMQMGMAVRCCSSRRPNRTGSVSVGSQWVQGCLASHCWEPWWLEKCVCAGESPGPPLFCSLFSTVCWVFFQPAAWTGNPVGVLYKSNYTFFLCSLGLGVWLLAGAFQVTQAWYRRGVWMSPDGGPIKQGLDADLE